MSILTVGTGQEFSTINAAVAASQDGDVIQVQAGTYTNDFATISTSITLEAVGGRVNMVATKPPPNDKGLLTIGTAGSAPDVTIDGFSFSGVHIPAKAGGNGAGIRYQSGNLTLNQDWFHNNQDGLLATPLATGDRQHHNQPERVRLQRQRHRSDARTVCRDDRLADHYQQLFPRCQRRP